MTLLWHSLSPFLLPLPWQWVFPTQRSSSAFWLLSAPAANSEYSLLLPSHQYSVILSCLCFGQVFYTHLVAQPVYWTLWEKVTTGRICVGKKFMASNHLWILRTPTTYLSFLGCASVSLYSSIPTPMPVPIPVGGWTTPLKSDTEHNGVYISINGLGFYLREVEIINHNSCDFFVSLSTNIITSVPFSPPKEAWSSTVFSWLTWNLPPLCSPSPVMSLLSSPLWFSPLA